MRTVICHYHIFKNSGTSFDALLKASFGRDRFVSFDGPFPYFSINQSELLRIVRRHPTAIAFSSHQLALPVPVSLTERIIPVVFVRHPLLRIQSVYNFRRRSMDGSDISTRAASMDFDEWCRFHLDHPQRLGNVSNVQTRFLGGVYGAPSLSRGSAEASIYDLDQALRNVRTIDLLGRTEFFESDVLHFRKQLKNEGIELDQTKVEPQNVSGTDFDLSLEERLEGLQKEVVPGTFKRLSEANRQDFALYDSVSRQIEGRS